jgi:hypothetical protein
MNSDEWRGSFVIPNRWERHEQSEDPKPGTFQSEILPRAEASSHSSRSAVRMGRAS